MNKASPSQVHWVNAARPILCVGLKGSASTWIFNVVIGVLKYAAARDGGSQPKVSQLFADDLSAIPDNVGDVDYLIVKSHAPSPSLCKFMLLSRGPVIVSVRDPRDAVVARMQRLGSGFDPALADVCTGSAYLALLRESGDTLALRYEDRFFDRKESVEAIAGYLGVTLPAAAVGEIFEALTRENVKAKIEELRQEGVFGLYGDYDSFDPQTHWHPNHVGDAQSGKFADVLSPAEQTAVLYATLNYSHAFGYDADLIADKDSPIAPLVHAGTDDERTDALVGLARLLAGEGRNKVALKVLDDAVAFRPRDQWIYNFRSNLKLEVNDIEGAEADIRTAIGLAPSTFDHYTQLARVLRASGRYEEARAALHEVDRLNPEDAWTYFNLAAVGMEAGDLSGAESYIREAAKLAPTVPDHLVQLAVIQRAQGNFQAAYETLQSALKQAPGSAWVYAQIGYLMLAWERFEDGIEPSTRAVEIEPARNDYRELLAELERKAAEA